MKYFCACLVLMGASSVAAEPSETELDAFSRRLLAALRAPESSANAATLVPSEAQLRDLVQAQPDANPRLRSAKPAEEAPDFRKDSAECLLKDFQEIREFLSLNGIDVTPQATLHSQPLEDGKSLLALRFPDSDVLLKARVEIINGRMFVGAMKLLACVKYGEQNISLGCLESFRAQDFSTDAQTGDVRMEFQLELSKVQRVRRDTLLDATVQFLKGLHANSAACLKELSGVLRRADALDLAVSGATAEAWLQAFKAQKSRAELAKLTCRRVDPAFLKEAAAHKTEGNAK